MKLAQILPTDPEKLKLDPNNTANDPIYQLIGRAIQLAMTLAGIIAVIYIIIGAFKYFTAYGDEAKATSAKTTITWAVVGVAVIILAKVIVTTIWSFIAAGSAPSFWF